jgi:tRNA A37 N6-isopentenylltransferase MiaA
LLRGLDRAWTKPPPSYPVLKVDRALLRQRIAERLATMYEMGLEAEKSRLRARYPVWSRTAALAIGYRTGDDRDKIFVRTCQLAKRQETWFRHQAEPIYVESTIEAVRECWKVHGPWRVTFRQS